MRQRSLAVVLFAAQACGPSAGDVVDATTTSGSSASTSSGTETSSTDATTVLSTEESGVVDSTEGMPTGTSEGGELSDPCLASAPPNCDPECTTVVAYAAGDGPCGVDATPNGARSFCASVGEPLADDYRSTFYATIEGHMWFTFSNQPCVETLPAGPLAWTECSGAADEPEFCACGCAQDECGWEHEALLLQSCAYPSPCGVVDAGIFGNAYSEAQICALTALRDRTLGELVVTTRGTGSESRVYIDGETAQHLRYDFPGICTGPLASAWDPSERCELAEPAYFDACLQAQDAEQQACVQVENWFTGCAAEPPVCP
jgi:hypothetical protein